jgi:hypothetical protein
MFNLLQEINGIKSIEDLILTEDQKSLDALVKAITVQLKSVGVDSASIFKKSSGTVRHLRLKVEDPASLFKSINIKLEPMIGSKIATGKASNQTFKATLLKAVDDFSKGESFIVVNTYSAGSKIGNKLLTPSKLGLESDDYIAASKIASMTKAALKDLECFSQEELQYFSKLLSLGKADTHEITAPSSLGAEDLNRIGIDFGEIFGAIWYSKKTGMGSILFPKGNNPLVDFELSDGTNEKMVSSKSGTGAPPSLDAVMTQIELDQKYFNKKYGKNIVDALLLIQNSSTVDGPLLAAQALNTPGYKKLSSMMKSTDMSSASVEKYLAKFETKEDLVKTMAPFFKLINRNTSDESLNIIFDQGQRRIGIVTAQLANYLCDLFNKDADYTIFNDLLNEAVRRIKVDQLYTNVKPDGIEFIMKAFETGTFSWINNSSTRKPSLKKIAFKMSSK